MYIDNLLLASFHWRGCWLAAGLTDWTRELRVWNAFTVLTYTMSYNANHVRVLDFGSYRAITLLALSLPMSYHLLPYAAATNHYGHILQNL